ncbi:MAG: ATP-binding protein, partial [Candidatus Limnocylindria bacterium]
QVLDTLREPMQEGRITIARAGTSATYPARFTLIAAMNPCPCGNLGDLMAPCTCLPDQVDRYNARISGPLLDRVDLRVHVPRVPYVELRDGTARERSAVVRQRVIAARARMRARGRRANAELTPPELRRHCSLGASAEVLLGRAVHDRRLSARAYHRTLRVARTIADLAGSDGVQRDHLASALLLRA